MEKIEEIEKFKEKNPPLITAYQLERELEASEGTLRYYIEKLVEPKIVKPRKKLYSRKEVIEALQERVRIAKGQKG